ncbi:MAG: hypothetical protein WBB01_19100 [Phormidesmis sp.]
MKNDFNQGASSDTESGVRNILTPLYRQWQRLTSFMVMPEDALPTQSEKRYASKTRLYPYLPATEEARDWLEKIYQKSQSKIGDRGE